MKDNFDFWLRAGSSQYLDSTGDGGAVAMPPHTGQGGATDITEKTEITGETGSKGLCKRLRDGGRRLLLQEDDILKEIL